MNPLYLLFSPLLAAVASWLAGRNAMAQKVLAFASLGFSLFVFQNWNASGFEDLSVSYPWIQSFGISLALAVNNLNYWFLVLTALVVFTAQLFHSTQGEDKVRGDVMALIFLLQFCLYGVFMAQDLMLFYFCYEASILPIYFISSRYGSPAAERAILKFFLYTLGGSLCMLLAILYMYNQNGSQDFLFSSFSSGYFQAPVQGWLFLAFFVAFAIKMPLFPFHSWQADAYAESPVESTMLMSGILLKMGIYGMMAIVIPYFPLGLKEYGFIFIGLSAFGVLYGAFIAMVQFDIRKVLAFSSLSHVGLIGTGLLTWENVAVEGVVLQMFAHGINIVGLFFISEIISQQAATRDLDQMGGLTRSSFTLTVLFFVFLLGSIAVPLTNGFPGEFKLIMGIFNYNHALGILCGSTVIFSSVYMLRMFQKSMLGESNGSTSIQAPALDGLRVAGLVILAGQVITLGLFPGIISGISDAAVRILMIAY
jgi:NADH-quinone oxidoreductase subunit M